MSSPTWQDRRGMFQSGKAVHEPAARRRSSASSNDTKAAKPGGLASLVALAGGEAAPESSTKFIYRRGKEVHEPSGGLAGGRKKSVGGAEPGEAKVVGVEGGEAAGLAGRRRSSASSQGGGAYNAVLSNPDYAQRRQSWDDMKAPGGFGGIFGNLMGRSAEKK